MAGRHCNPHRKRDAIVKDGPQLRQTKLVLRVTAKRLTYNTNNSIYKTHIEECTPVTYGGNSSESKFVAVPEVCGQNTVSISTSKCESYLTQFKDPNSTPPGELSIRPKRNAFLKRSESCGLSWKEETELKKALYASLQRKKIKTETVTKVESNANMPDVLIQDIKRKFSSLEPQSLEIFSQVSNRMNKKVNDSTSIHYNKSQNSGLFRAQRKFAYSTKLVGNSLSNRRKFMKKVDCSQPDNSQNVPYTEDFIDYLCLRGTPFLPESLRFFDKIVCSNMETHLETPSSCSSTDFVSPPVNIITRKTFHRKCPRTRKSSGLKNKEFRNEKYSKAAINSIVESRPFTRSLTSKEAVDSDHVMDESAISIDKQEVESSAIYDFSAVDIVGDGNDCDDDYDDDDDEDEDDDDDDDSESEGLSEVLSCFVQDQQHLFDNVNSMMFHDVGADDDEESGWMADKHKTCDDPSSTHSDDNLNPADGYCTGQSFDDVSGCKCYGGNDLFDDSDYNDDVNDDNDDEEEEAELCLEFLDKKVNDFELEDEMKCDGNNNEIGTCIGAVNKCVGTDTIDVQDSLLEPNSLFSNHFQLHNQIVRNQNIDESSPANTNRSMLPKLSTNLPFIQPSFKCIIPDNVVHDSQVLMANVPVVNMTSLSSVLMMPTMQNIGVNFFQFLSPSMLALWQNGGHTSRHDLSSVFMSSSKMFDLSPFFSTKDVDNSQSLRKIAPKISVARGSLELARPSLSHSSMNFHGDLTIQQTDGAQACASDIPQNSLVEQNEVKKTRGFFRKVKRKPYWRKLMGIVHSNSEENLEVKKTEMKNDKNDAPSTINLRSGKVITVEGPKKTQNNEENKTTASNISDQKKNDAIPPDEGTNENNSSRKLSFGGRRRKRRRRRKGSIELIDRSWNRSGVKKCPAGKSVRPVTRSRTFGGESTRPKIDIDDYDDSL